MGLSIDELVEKRQKLRDRKPRLDILWEAAERRRTELLELMAQEGTSPETIQADIETVAREEAAYLEDKEREIAEWERQIEQAEKILQG